LFTFLSPHCPQFVQMDEKLYMAMPRARKNTHFKLTEDEKKAFETLKVACADPKALFIPDDGKLLFLECDASATVASCILFCHDGKGTRNIVGYQSRLFNSSLRVRRSAIEKEAISIILGLHFGRFHILKHPTILLTDSMAILALIVSGKVSQNQKLELFLSKMSTYPVKFQIHLKDQDQRADAMTRYSKNRVKMPVYSLPQGGYGELEKDQIVCPFQEGQILTLGEMEKKCMENPHKIIPSL
jgi:hypothetical protein